MRNRHRDGTPIHNDKKHLQGLERNFEVQYYKGIPLKQIDRGYGNAKARRFTINHTNQNCWIPLRHLHQDGTIKQKQDIDYVIFGNKIQFKKAGVKIKFEVQEANYELLR
mgnify:CR=1 FL=1